VNIYFKKFVAAPLIISCFLLQGCETLGPNLNGKRLIGEPKLHDATRGNLAESKETIQPSSLDLREPKLKGEIYAGTGNFVNVKNNKTKQEIEKKGGSYTLNFTDVDLSEVIHIILGDTLKYNFSISSKVQGKVSLQTNRALTKSELLPTLQVLLGMNNTVIVEENGFYRIQPKNIALVGGGIPLVLNKGFVNKGSQLRVIPLKYIGVTEIKKTLEPLIAKGAIIQVDTVRNLLFASGTQAEINNVQALVSLFDTDLMKGKSIGIFPLNYVDAEVIEKELVGIFGLSAEGPLAGVLETIPMERLNALMVISSQPHYLPQVQKWIKRLDKASAQGDAGYVHVYHVQNVDATELADVLSQIYLDKGEEDKRKRLSRKEASLAPGLKPVVISSNEAGRVKQKPAVNQTASSSSSSSSTDGEVRIIPDEMNNSLVIVAGKQDYESIKKVLAQLDVTPLQVLVDATIVEVSLTDELHYGLQWFFTNKSGGYTGTGRIGDSNLNAAGVGGFAYSVVNSSNLVRAELNALASDSKVKVLSSPSLMVLNNQEATIKVGDQVPIRTSESANTSSTVGNSAIITSTIQMRDTGVTLTVKPRVNAGGLVIMEIEQNVDGVSRTESSEIDSPTIQQRQIKTSVAVHSGETIVLGGLITEQREQGKSGVPVLSRLPVIGALFGKTDKVLDRTELVVLLTPRVVTNRVDSRAITYEFKRKLTDIYTSLRDEKSAQERK